LFDFLLTVDLMILRRVTDYALTAA
jgi:hypothetical protein